MVLKTLADTECFLVVTTGIATRELFQMQNGPKPPRTENDKEQIGFEGENALIRVELEWLFGYDVIREVNLHFLIILDQHSNDINF